ncbi:MAG: XRE family transcriptional regulator [Acidobacteria bacterium]|nr:XRE family transcriptional regulator [Acidobacteriota bacterium]
MKKKHIGSTFEDFLKGEDICEEATGYAIKRAIAWQLAEVMKEQKISKTEMARRLKTSRAQIACILDPENCSVQLDTMQKAAAIIDKRLVIKLENLPRSAA